jgi:hypothetical protein
MGILTRVQDGWENFLTGMGRANQDKSVHTTYEFDGFLDQVTLSNIYMSNGLGARIVDILPDEMLREGFHIEGDPDELVESRLEEIAGMEEIEYLLKWDRLFGGALLLMGIDDGSLDMALPVNEKAVKNLIFLKTYDRFQVSYSSDDLYQDVTNPKYGKVQFYNIYPNDGTPILRVHESRCIVLKGRRIPSRSMSLNSGWGISELQRIMTQLRSVGTNFASVDSILDDFITGILSVKNLADMMYAGQDAKVKNRVELLDLTKHIINTMILDADNETYTKNASSVAGLAEILDKVMSMLCAVSGIPYRKLYGIQSGGLNNTGKGETDDWNDKVKVAQENILKPVIERIAHIIFISKDGAFKGIEPKDWSIEFEPLERMNEKEEAEIKKINAETDAIYITNGVLDPDEVADQRFGGEIYGKEIHLSEPRE